MKVCKGFTLVELLVVVVILGILSLIAAGYMLNLVDRAKESAVKANASHAVSTATTFLLVGNAGQPMDADSAAQASVNRLNMGNDLAENTADDSKSPFDNTLNAFVVNSNGAGQVSLSGDADTNSITVIGYGKDGSTAIITKRIDLPQESTS